MQLFNKDELNKELDLIDTSYSSVCSKTSLPVLDALLAKACKDGKSGILNKTAVFLCSSSFKNFN